MGMNKIYFTGTNFLKGLCGKRKTCAVTHKLCGVNAGKTHHSVWIRAVICAGVIRRCNRGCAVFPFDYRSIVKNGICNAVNKRRKAVIYKADIHLVSHAATSLRVIVAWLN